MGELICPRTQKLCIYGDFCAVRKIDTNAEGAPSPSVKRVVQLLDELRVAGVPSELQEAQKSSYCSDERIRAVGIAAAEITATDDTDFIEKREAQHYAVAMVGGIITERECHRQVQSACAPEPPAA